MNSARQRSVLNQNPTAAAPLLAPCGYHCDLCPAYRANIRGPGDQHRTSNGWFRYFGFRIPPKQICCDGCLDMRPEARHIDQDCPVRPCALRRGVPTCAHCPDYACAHLAARTVTRRGVEKAYGAAIPAGDLLRYVQPYEGRARLDRMRSGQGLAPPAPAGLNL